MKKKIFCIICIIAICAMMTFSTVASGIYGTTTMNETFNTTSNGQCISLMITRPIIRESIPPTTYTYSTVIDTSMVYSSRYDEYYFSTQNTILSNNRFNQNETNYLTNENITTNVNAISVFQDNEIWYMTQLNYNATENSAIMDYAIDIEAKYLGENETIYIDKSYIETFIGGSQYGITTGNATVEKTVSCSAISMFTMNAGGIEKTYWETYTTTGSTEQEVAETLLDYINTTESLGATVYDTIGIYDYKVNYKITYTPDNNNNYQSTLIFQRPLERIETLSASDFLSQNPNGDELGGTTTVVVEGELDLAGIMTSIKNALAVDILGFVSILDILTIMVSVAITYWLLKVFAGG